MRSECAQDPLRDRLARCVEGTTLSLLDPDRIEALAEDMRVIERKRVHHSGLVVCALVLSALERSTDTKGRLLDGQAAKLKLRAVYSVRANTAISVRTTARRTGCGFSP